MKETPLHSEHLSLNARMMPFAGWDMPLQYSSIIDEHLAVRSHCGAFDVSHMGDIIVRGSRANETIERLMTNDVVSAPIGRCVYSHILDENGKILDDTIVTRLGDDEFLVVPNAATTPTILRWIRTHSEGAEVVDLSDALSAIAVQGPTAALALAELTTADLSSIGPFWATFADLDKIGGDGEPTNPLLTSRDGLSGNGVSAFLSRTGYTGEDGFEVVCENSAAAKVWDALLTLGKEHGLRPVGLGARDTLRLEKGLLLSGTDFDGSQTSLQTGPSWVVKDGHEFIGREAILRQRAEGGYQKLVGMKMKARGVPRHGYDVVMGSDTVGKVTSGTLSPVLKEGIALGYAPFGRADVGTEVLIRIREGLVPAEIVKTPFVKRELK